MIINPLTRELFADGGDSFHDCINNVRMECDLPTLDFSKDELMEAFEVLPRNIKLEAYDWGFDTCVRDAIYVWYSNVYAWSKV